MARDHGKIKCSLWRSQKFRKLANSDRPKLQYCYFHTCPHGNSIGCYPIAVGYMTADLGWGEEQVAEAIDALVLVNLTEWNPDEQIIRIIGFIERDAPTNIKHAAFMAKEAMSLPDCIEKLHVIEDLLNQKFIAEQDRLSAERNRLSIAYAKPIGPSPSPSPVPEPLPDPKSPRGDLILSEPSVPDASASSKKSRGRQPYPQKFEEFWRAYPTDPNMAKLKAFEQWKRLSPDEQDAAIKAVPAFRRYCDEHAKSGYRPVHAERFLSERRFEGFNEPVQSKGHASLEELREQKARAMAMGIPTVKLDRAIAELEQASVH